MSFFPQQFPKYFTVDAGQPCPLCIQNFDLPVLPRLRGAIQYDDGTGKDLLRGLRVQGVGREG